MKTYKDWLKVYKGSINSVCKNLVKQYRNPRVEFEDLYQQATIALWDLFENNKEVLKNKGYCVIAIKHKVIDYLRKETTISVTDPKTGKQKRILKPLYQAENKGLIIW